MSTTYIHYGHTEFKKDLFQPIQNRPMWNKPSGGLWASATDAERGWKQWAEAEDFMVCKEENSFSFKLAEDAKVCHLYSADDLDKLPRQEMSDIYKTLGIKRIYPDFEKTMEMGYDAIEIHISSDGELYNALYGWDCDSIVVLNPDIVVPLEREIKEAGNTEDIVNRSDTEDIEEDWEP